MSFAVFNPRFKPFGTVCTDCEATLPEGTTVADAARLAPWSHRPAPPPVPAPSEVEARRRDDERLRAERDAKFIAFCGQPGAPLVEIPDGMMAVTLSLKYDNSDSMTDYFDRHAPLSPEFLVLLVKKQAQTERLARKALAQASLGRPELSLDGWKWKTEKYSMGHGNYLTSGGFSLPETLQGLETHYRGGQVTHAHWEIEFTCGGRYGRPLHPHASYGRKAAPAFSSEPATSRMTVTATQHTKHGYPIWVVQLADRVDRPEFERLRDVCKSLGGWYSSYRGHGAIPGFTFKEEASAKAFIADESPVAAPEPTPEQLERRAEEASERRIEAMDDAEIAARTKILMSGRTAVLPPVHVRADDPNLGKVAWIRNPDVPAGQPAKGRLNCRCGAAPESDFRPENGDVTCACGQIYTWDGWKKSKTVPITMPDPVSNIVPVNFAPPPAPRPNPMLRRLQRPC